jgi:hypothetical protein
MHVHRRAELLAVVPLRPISLNNQGRRYRPWLITKEFKMKIPTGLYLGLAVIRRRARQVVAKLSGHGIFDLKHFRLLTNPNLPIWLAMLWIAFDLLVTAVGRWRFANAANTKSFAFRLLEVQA